METFITYGSDNERQTKYATLAKELGRLPTTSDLRLKTRTSPNFPSHNTFNRFGSKSALVENVLRFCKAQPNFQDVVALCNSYRSNDSRPMQGYVGESSKEIDVEFVYLMKSGRFFKIGKSNDASRRAYELAIQLPEKLTTVHTIRTDDPSGIEEYWHKRFSSKRQNGEWFDLSGADVVAFKRRKFM